MATRAEGENRGGQCSDDAERVSSSATSLSATRRAIKSDDESWNEVLERACSSLSDATTSEMVEVANSERLQKAVDDLVPTYFNTWQLRSTESILVFVLLNFFVLRQECCELKADRGNYEDHIAMLKKKVGDLEEENTQLRRLDERKNRRSPGRVDQPCSQGSVGEVARLTESLHEITMENSRLLQAKEELYRINQQWALDYESLTHRVATNSSFSLSSMASSQSGCPHCITMEHQVEQLSSKCDELQQKSRQEISRRDREIKQLEDTNQAIQMQLQELGDLQVAMKIKGDYGRLQRRCHQLEGENQDLMCERLRLHKQLEKVRHAFLHLFPFGASPLSATRTSSYHNTIPPRSCRRQRIDSTPPTPPGLIARGIQHQDSMVERDIQTTQPYSDDAVYYGRMSNGTLELRDEPRTWPEAPKRKRPDTLLPPHHFQCPSCSQSFNRTEDEIERFFDHVQYCGQ